MRTSHSLASSLNFQYINDLEKEFADTTNRGPSTYLINHSLIVNALKNQGYKLVNIESFVEFTRPQNTDVNIAPRLGAINQLESLLITLSSTDLFFEEFLPDTPLISYQSERNRIKFELNSLAEVYKIDGKKFVFAHILSPHPPFIFDAQGNPVQPDRPFTIADGPTFAGSVDEYDQGYKEQTIYLNSLLEKSIDSILSNSKRPAIIIIQGDHGPGSTHPPTTTNSMDGLCLQERFAILNAFYFPDQNYSNLPANITPVNTFRIVLNQYFGGKLSLLDNQQYFSSAYKFENVTGQTFRACQDTN